MPKEVWHRFEVFKKMEQFGVVPTAYESSINDYLYTIDALLMGGLPVIEILLRENHSVPPRVSLDAIYEVRKRHPEVLVGAGTCPSGEKVHAAINQGAQFIVSNLVSEEVIKAAYANCTPVTPGVFTDTEVGQAMYLGCDTVKLLLPDWDGTCSDRQSSRLAFFKHFKDHFPRMVFFPTMSIKTYEVANLLKAGAPFVVMGISNSKILESKKWKEITEKTRAYLEAVKIARLINDNS